MPGGGPARGLHRDHDPHRVVEVEPLGGLPPFAAQVLVRDLQEPLLLVVGEQRPDHEVLSDERRSLCGQPRNLIGTQASPAQVYRSRQPVATSL